MSATNRGEVVDVDRDFRIASANEFLPRADALGTQARESDLGVLLKHVPTTDCISQSPPFCFENDAQPEYSRDLCDLPLKVKTLYLPVVNRARLLGSGVVLAQNDAILGESIGRHAGRMGLEVTGDRTCRLAPALKLAVHRAQKRQVSTHDCTGLLLFDPAIHHFGMWMLKCLPKLSILPLLKYSDIRVVVPMSVPDLYLSMMQDLGIESDRIVYHDPGGVSVFRRLIVPPKTYTFMSARYGNPFEVFRYDLREDLGATSPLLVQTPPKERLYISRLGNNRRRLVDEAEVKRVFADFDFHSVEPSTLTAAETVSLFANCRIIAGPSGSGLYNLLLSRHRPRALVLVAPEEKFDKAFLTMNHVCTGKGGSAGFLFGRMLDDRRAEGREFDYSWEVDLGCLREVLAQLD